MEDAFLRWPFSLYKVHQLAWFVPPPAAEELSARFRTPQPPPAQKIQVETNDKTFSLGLYRVDQDRSSSFNTQVISLLAYMLTYKGWISVGGAASASRRASILVFLRLCVSSRVSHFSDSGQGGYYQESCILYLVFQVDLRPFLDIFRPFLDVFETFFFMIDFFFDLF